MVSAEFFDIFGFIGFLILLILGLRIRKKVKTEGWIIIAISIIGLVVDGLVVFNTYIR